jgi:EpsD family peptidyl-prolyl cis-trans isomerase
MPLPNASHFRRASTPAVTKRLLLLAGLIGVAIALSACGRGDGTKAASQVAAKVNGGEISVHQINNVIAGSNEVPPEQAKQAAAQALERIIDQELLVQRAIKARLDRDPQVMQAIEAAKRQILAQAYIDRAVAASASVTGGQEEARKFYKENPALFERRRVYRLHELQAVAPPEKLVALAAVVSEAKSLDRVAEWLRSQKLPFQVATSSRSAEQIPLSMLARMVEMRDGQIAVFPTRDGAAVVQLLRSQDAPLSEQQAAPIIERFLFSRKRLEVAQAEVKKLREQAKIEYVGEYEAAHRAAPVPPASSGADPGGNVEENGYIKKGLAGLR